MFDQFQNEPKKSAWIGPKMLVAASAGILLSFGLCGFGMVIHIGRIGHGLGLLGTTGLYLLGISVVTFVIGIIVTVVEVILASTRGK